ncbi:hypothetical protein BKA66DRAFT_468429 [Pyrenochaeta sp. MPI-SDFR-AT-0127]|nr:hypothetical protein BKA66DRAFT_468429 [Pyrenochaeta sp. MPI-SDFR-AT-0127]
MPSPDAHYTSQEQTPEDGSRPSRILTDSTSSPTQPTTITEHGRDGILKPPSLLPATFPRSTKSATQAYYGSDSTSVYDDELNAIMAESWSAPTYVESCTGRSSGCGGVEQPPAQWQVGYITQILESCQSPTKPETIAPISSKSNCIRSETLRGAMEPLPGGLLFTGMPSISKIVSGLSFQHQLSLTGTYCPMDQFLNEDSGAVPWRTVNLRSPGSICAFCGSPFNGIDHKQSVIAHIRQHHPESLQAQSSGAGCTHKALHLRRDPKASYIATNRDSLIDSHFEASKELNATWPIGKLVKSAHDFDAIGLWRYRDFSASRRALKAKPATQPRLIDDNNPNIPHDRFLFLLNSLDPKVHPTRSNDFFNSLDIIVGNLVDKFPGDIAVHGIQLALAHLARLYQLNFGGSSIKVNQSTSIAVHNGARVCAIRQHGGDSPSSNASSSSLHSNNGVTNQKTNNSKLNGSKGMIPGKTPKNDLKKPRRKQTPGNGRLLLACPFRKNCEVNGQDPSCTFGGSADMSSVTQHLKTRAHRQALDFLALCRNCWHYVLDQREYRDHHGVSQCSRRAQPRESLVASHWHSLYRTLFPDSGRLPSPYIGNTIWQSAHASNVPSHGAEDEDSGLDFNATPTIQPFLEQVPPATQIGLPPVGSMDVQTGRFTVEDAVAAATNLFVQMLAEHVWQPYDLNDHFTASFVNNANQLRPEELDTFIERVHARVNEMLASLPVAQASAAAVPQNVNFPEPQLAIMNEPRTYHSNNISPNGLWLGQFPVPQYLEPYESTHFHSEQHSADLSSSWRVCDVLASPELSSYVNDRIFYPELDLSQVPYGVGLVSRDASPSVIPA